MLYNRADVESALLHLDAKLKVPVRMIAYRVTGDTVSVLGVYYRGQGYDTRFLEEPETLAVRPSGSMVEIWGPHTQSTHRRGGTGKHRTTRQARHQYQQQRNTNHFPDHHILPVHTSIYDADCDATSFGGGEH
jgi:hypothetical protein